MSTLLLRFAAPLQSWGADAKFNRRGTERAPTKSGVIGLIAGAMGRRRDESVADLAALRFGVRVDREGMLLRDYHTGKSKKEKDPYVTNRYYLSDAVFLVGLEGSEALLNQIERALGHPAFPLFLGRRSCPPEGKLLLGIRQGKDVHTALEEEPWQVDDWNGRRKDPEELRIILDAGPADAHGYFQRDVPLSFDQTHRQFGFRRMYEATAVLAQNSPPREETEHDPFFAWEV